MADPPTKPYLVRAIHEWCTDAGFTPYLAVKVSPATRVPPAYVKNGEIVLNVSHAATRNLTISNELIQFSARFGGISQEVSVPMEAVAGIFSRETGKGMFFEPEVGGPSSVDSATLPRSGEEAADPDKPAPPRKPSLKLVK